MVWTPCPFDFDDMMEGWGRNENQSQGKGNGSLIKIFTSEANFLW